MEGGVDSKAHSVAHTPSTLAGERERPIVRLPNDHVAAPSRASRRLRSILRAPRRQGMTGKNINLDEQLKRWMECGLMCAVDASSSKFCCRALAGDPDIFLRGSFDCSSVFLSFLGSLPIRGSHGLTKRLHLFLPLQTVERSATPT